MSHFVKIKENILQELNTLKISLLYTELNIIHEELKEVIGKKYENMELNLSYIYNEFMIGLYENPIKLVAYNFIELDKKGAIKQWDLKSLIPEEKKELFYNFKKITEDLICLNYGEELKTKFTNWNQNTKNKKLDVNKNGFSKEEIEYAYIIGFVKKIKCQSPATNINFLNSFIKEQYRTSITLVLEKKQNLENKENNKKSLDLNIKIRNSI